MGNVKTPTLLSLLTKPNKRPHYASLSREMSATKDSTPAATKETAKTEVQKPAPPPATPSTEIKNNAVLIERAVSTLEPRFTHRVLKSLTTLRKRLNGVYLKEAITALYPAGTSVSDSSSGQGLT